MSDDSDGKEPCSDTEHTSHFKTYNTLLSEHRDVVQTVKDAYDQLARTTKTGKKVEVGNIQYFDGSWKLHSDEYLERLLNPADADDDSSDICNIRETLSGAGDAPM